VTWIGMDGGGTRLRGVLVDAAGHVHARAEGPAGLVLAAEPAAAAGAIVELARQLLQQAGSARAAALCCGLAGAGRATEREAVRRHVEAAGVAARVLVVTDAEAALEDAFHGGSGVLLIAGTGSIAWAAGPDGAVVRAGGWGRLLGDEGSGYTIAAAGLRAVLRAADERSAPTSLTSRLLAATGVTGAADLVRFVELATKGGIAALAPTVIACAADGDEAATAIVDEAVNELVLLATTAARRARLEHPLVALAGGVIEPGAALRARVQQALRRSLPGCSIHEDRVEGDKGAARIARRAHP
jgi:N-acetylglucosamine kinase-like BadF-type ATPase